MSTTIKEVADDVKRTFGIKTDKETPENVAEIKEIFRKAGELYEKKNRGYKDAFSEVADKRGLVSALTMLDIKKARIDAIAEEKNFKGEDMYDSLKDLMVYCAMTMYWLKSRNK